MKFLQILAIAATASAIAIEPRHHAGKKTKHTKTAVAAAASATSVAAAAAASSSATAATANVAAAADTNSIANGQTVVLFEVNGVPGNECLTFRNNGKFLVLSLLSSLRSQSRSLCPARTSTFRISQSWTSR